jgi:hypothetical protein
VTITAKADREIETTAVQAGWWLGVIEKEISDIQPRLELAADMRWRPRSPPPRVTLTVEPSY